MAQQKSLVEQAWAQLDETTEAIVQGMMRPMSAAPEQHVNGLKAAARGKAEILALFLGLKVDTVAKEATRRYREMQSSGSITEHNAAELRTMWEPLS
jgi:hypothetical protein